VDLVVTIRKRDDSISRTVVSNAEVLTAGTRYDQQKATKDGKGPSTAAVVTLLLTPEDAERIALAQAEGQIMLVLRNPLDTEPTATPGIRTAALLGQTVEPPAPVVRAVSTRKAPQAAAPAPAPVPATRMYMVEAIRAAKRTEEVVR
jgi:pilus assembly protein CpaB